MKLWNVITTYDVYILAATEEEAVATAKRLIERSTPPSERVAIEARYARHIRRTWLDQQPFVADAVTDAEATALGTTQEAWAQLYDNPKSVTAKVKP